MARYIDLKMTVNASKTRQRLGWAPRPRLELLRRMPFLLENRKCNPLEWNRLNRAAMKVVNIRPNLMIHRLLEEHKEEIRRALTQHLTTAHGHLRLIHYEHIPAHEHDWHHRQILRSLMNSIRTARRQSSCPTAGTLPNAVYSQGFRRRGGLLCPHQPQPGLPEGAVFRPRGPEPSPPVRLRDRDHPVVASTRFRTSSSSLGVSQAHRRRRPLKTCFGATALRGARGGPRFLPPD